MLSDWVTLTCSEIPIIKDRRTQAGAVCCLTQAKCQIPLVLIDFLYRGGMEPGLLIVLRQVTVAYTTGPVS